MTRLICLSVLVGSMVFGVALAGCSSSQKKVANNAGGAASDAGDVASNAAGASDEAAKWMSEPDEKGNTTPHKKFSAGPDGSVKVGNATCPMKGFEITPANGFVYNGWYISYCCLGCDLDFEDNVDKCAAELLKISGIDVRVAPTEEQKAAARPQ